MRRSSAGSIAMVAAVGVLLTTAGCGGGSTTTQETPVLLVIESDGARDGFVRSDGFVRVSGNGPGVGDLDGARLGLGLRMFYSFPLRQIPDGAVITSVTLRVFQVGTIGQPYANLGDLLVDHVDPGDALDPSDYAGNTLETNVGSLSREFVRRYANLDVQRCMVRDQVDGRARSWFRLRFPRDSNLDGGDDALKLNDGENSRGTSGPPVLEVIYRRP